MSIDVFNAYVKGYGDHLFDQQVLAVQMGYWAGYYSKAKHPKNIKTILQNMLRKRQNAEKRIKSPALEVDVETYLETERQFKEKMSQ